MPVRLSLPPLTGPGQLARAFLLIVPFMVAGGVLFVAGAIVGDDAGTLFMLGGAGLGAYVAYVYFGGSS